VQRALQPPATKSGAAPFPTPSRGPRPRDGAVRSCRTHDLWRLSPAPGADCSLARLEGRRDRSPGRECRASGVMRPTPPVRRSHPRPRHPSRPRSRWRRDGWGVPWLPSKDRSSERLRRTQLRADVPGGALTVRGTRVLADSSVAAVKTGCGAGQNVSERRARRSGKRFAADAHAGLQTSAAAHAIRWLDAARPDRNTVIRAAPQARESPGDRRPGRAAGHLATVLRCSARRLTRDLRAIFVSAPAQPPQKEALANLS
jgi:hypothetical protein